MKRDYRVYVDDMIEAIDRIAEYVRGTDEIRFSRDNEKQDAVIRRLSIIGEAATKIPQEVQILAPSIPWKLIVGFRNIVIHEYANVSMGKAWEVTQHDLPKLKIALVALLSLLDSQDGDLLKPDGGKR